MGNSERRRPLRVGVQLPEAEYEASWAQMMAMGQAAEAAGFDSLWLGDHLIYEDDNGGTRGTRGVWEAWTMLAGLAAVTSTIELGPLVACTSYHNPAMIAKKAATLDEISGGRLILGLGAGWNEAEYRAFGFPYDHRVSRFAEAFTIIRTLLADGEIDFHGEYYTADHCTLKPRGPRPGGIPLMVGSSRPRMLDITLPYVDVWNAWFLDFKNDPANLPPILARIDEACLAVGRDPAAVERTVAVLIAMEGATGRSSGDPDADPAVASLPSSQLAKSGSPAELAAFLRSFAEVGISHVQVVLDPITADAIEQFAPVLALLDAGE